MNNKNELREDNRANIGKELLDELKVGGKFYEFVKFVKETEKTNSKYPTLTLCFRGNNKTKNVNIYYHNHQVWKLYISNHKPVVEISFNHARFSSDWEDKLRILWNKYNFRKDTRNYKLETYEDAISLKKNNTNDNGYFKAVEDDSNRPLFTADYVRETFEIIFSIIENFFDTSATYDYFKKIPSSPKHLLEKIRQQELYLEFNNSKNGLYVYDLEFAQPTGTNVKINDNNQPDMLAIRFKNGIPTSVTLIEVKCKIGALNGNSGFKDHLTKMEDYKMNKNAITNRLNEAKQIIALYKMLGLHNSIEINDSIDYTKLPVELLFILTDEAAEYYIRNETKFKKILTDYKIENKSDYYNYKRIEIYK